MDKRTKTLLQALLGVGEPRSSGDDIEAFRERRTATEKALQNRIAVLELESIETSAQCAKLTRQIEYCQNEVNNLRKLIEELR